MDITLRVDPRTLTMAVYEGDRCIGSGLSPEEADRLFSSLINRSLSLPSR